MVIINAVIDGMPVAVEEGTTIINAAKLVNAQIPTLCYHPFLSTEGACRICVVEVAGNKNFPPACATKIAEGMVIRTQSPEIRKVRHDIVELMLDNHPKNCLTCVRGGNCELQDLAHRLGVRDRMYEGKRIEHKIENSGVSVIRDSDKCVKCRRCIRVCSEIQGVNNLQQVYRGVNCIVAPAFEAKMDDSVCIQCGQCVNVCPTAALQEKNDTNEVWNLLADPDRYVIVQTAPAVRAAIGEMWNIPHDDVSVTGKMVTALKRLGFKKVFDTNFTADLTIVEESHEFLERIKKDENLPLITSCSSGWINFLEHFYPEFIPNTSTCKSPMQMLSSISKSFFAQKLGVDSKKMSMVAIMPCTAKKHEAKRVEHYTQWGDPFTDVVLTTRELIWMIKTYGIDLSTLEATPFDDPFGESSGGASIFGTTGGVMEATLRTAVEKLTGESIGKIEYEEVRAVEGLRETTLNINGMELNIAVANGLNNAKILLERVKSGKKKYHLLEIMACSGGCIAGGGQPFALSSFFPMDPKLTEKRRLALYNIDKNKTVRKSHDNPAVKRIYEEILINPGSEIAHKILHTKYLPQEPRGIK